MEKGVAAGATVVGIEQRLDDGTTKRFVAVAVPTASGTRTGGVEVMHGPADVLARVRLGVEMVVRHDGGDAVVLDWPAMCALWGLPGEPGQKRHRKPPGNGVTDKAVDWADQRRLKQWTPRRATITSLRRRDGVMGPTLSFDVALRLDDGAEAAAGNTEIPFYAAWLAAPGAEVPGRRGPRAPGEGRRRLGRSRQRAEPVARASGRPAAGRQRSRAPQRGNRDLARAGPPAVVRRAAGVRYHLTA